MYWMNYCCPQMCDDSLLWQVVTNRYETILWTNARTLNPEMFILSTSSVNANQYSEDIWLAVHAAVNLPLWVIKAGRCYWLYLTCHYFIIHSFRWRNFILNTALRRIAQDTKLCRAFWQKGVRPGFLAGNSVFWRETRSVNIVSTASYQRNHNAAIRKQMWFTFLTATD